MIFITTVSDKIYTRITYVLTRQRILFCYNVIYYYNLRVYIFFFLNIKFITVKKLHLCYQLFTMICEIRLLNQIYFIRNRHKFYVHQSRMPFFFFFYSFIKRCLSYSFVSYPYRSIHYNYYSFALLLIQYFHVMKRQYYFSLCKYK